MHETDSSQRSAIEWPTVLVAATIYAGFGLVTWFHETLPWWALGAAGAYLVAWHGSLQHEVVHGHPTRWRGLNLMLVLPAPALWLPFELYRSSHLAHHRAPALADPAGDPESFYARADGTVARSRVLRTLAAAHNTLAGRLVLGPIVLFAGSLADGARRIGRGDRPAVRAWSVHLLGCAIVLVWVVGICEMSPWLYLAAFVYPGTALTLLRSFAEHEASMDPGGRTAVVEAETLLALVFLNNNLHTVHHAHPALPWYRIPERWAAAREELIATRPELVHAGYAQLVRRYALRPKEPVLYPL